MKTCWLDRFCCKVRGWVLRRGLAPHQQNKTNIIRKDCFSSCDPLLADMQGTCKTRLAPRKVYNIWFFIKIIKIVGKIVCRPVCSGDCTLGDSPVVERQWQYMAYVRSVTQKTTKDAWNGRKMSFAQRKTDESLWKWRKATKNYENKETQKDSRCMGENGRKAFENIGS